MTWPGLTQDVEHQSCMFHLSNISNEKEGADTQEIWNAPTKTIESDTVYLGHGLYGSCGSIYNKDII
jgi:hypothetical protein